MPQKALSLRKIREVLRLRYDLGLLQQEIATKASKAAAKARTAKAKAKRKRGYQNCAQFCAYRQSRPLATNYDASWRKP